jgi:predicted 3-demethylubiquinone-9 3-methyltransferase (glyoxalase superfamily)
MSAKSIKPCLWFDTEGEDAAKHYVSIFKNAKILNVSRYGNEGKEIHGKDAGTVMAVEFEIQGITFVALNGGPHFKFSEAVSFQIHCDTQDEVDHFWSKLSEGGSEGPCGWLKDKFGLSWQVVPSALITMLQDKNAAKSQRTMKAMLQMKKMDIAALERAHAG